MTPNTPAHFGAEPEKKAPQSPINGTYRRLVILSDSDWYVDGPWKMLIGTATIPGFVHVENSSFVPATAVAYAER